MKKQIIIALINAIIMACVMSFVMALFNIGLSRLLVNAWVKSWFIGSIIAFPLSLMLPPIISKFVSSYIE